MKNTIRIFCLLSVCFGVSACGNEYTQTFNTYKEICEFSGGTYIGDNDDNIGKCKCGNNIPCNPGVACINGKCADNCNNGDTKCEDNYLNKCINGKWTEEETCPNDYGCTPDGRKCAECKKDDTRCTNNNTENTDTEQHCENGLFVNVKQCGSYGCLSDQSKCAECNTEQQCTSENSYRTCVEGKWSSETKKCLDDKPYCSDGKCVVSGCKDGETICTGHTLLKCENNTWSTYECYKDCNTSTNNCTPCDEDDFKCNDSKFAYCKDGISIETTCTIDENVTVSCSDNQCGVCMNGDTQCKDGKLQNCENGSWGDDESCIFGCITTDGIANCKKCADSTTRCENINNIGQMQTCVNGSWVLGNKCTYGSKPASCNSNNECGECKSNTKQCTNNDQNIGHTQSCSAGSWLPQQICNNVSCNSNNECGECKNGETRCTDNAEQKCENGDWITTTMCPFGCNWKLECKCRPEDYRCNGNVLEYCASDGTWSRQNNLTTCTCKNRENSVGYITDNTTANNHMCVYGFSCDEESKCGECTNETQIYGNIGSNSSYLKCKNGKWEGSMIEGSCDNDNDEESCLGWGTLPTDTKEKYYKFKCINNKWVNIDVCQEEGCQNCWGDVT